VTFPIQLQTTMSTQVSFSRATWVSQDKNRFLLVTRSILLWRDNNFGFQDYNTSNAIITTAQALLRTL